MLKNWGSIVNTVLLLLTIVGLAAAGEHRLTAVETRLVNVEDAILELKDINKELVNKQNSNAENIVQAAAILKSTCESLSALDMQLHQHIMK